MKGRYSFLRSQISRPRVHSRSMTISQCSGHSSICRTWRPAASTFSAIRVARFWHRGLLHLRNIPAPMDANRWRFWIEVWLKHPLILLDGEIQAMRHRKIRL